MEVSNHKGESEIFGMPLDHVEFLFPSEKRKIFYRYQNHKELEYDHNNYWKDPVVGMDIPVRKSYITYGYHL
jgi:hypothetical protein